MDYDTAYALRLTDSAKNGWSEGSYFSISSTYNYGDNFTLSNTKQSIQVFYHVPPLFIPKNIISECEKVNYNCWGKIEIGPGICNTIFTPISLSNYPFLEILHFERAACKSTPAVTIMDNPRLKSIVIENSFGGSPAFGDAKTLIISSIVIYLLYFTSIFLS